VATGDPLPNVPFTRDAARRSGLTDRQIDRRRATGDLVAVRRGVLRQPTPPDAAIPVDIRAAALAHSGRDLVISHASAARLYGFPRPLSGWGEPFFTTSSGATRHRHGVWIRVAPLPPKDLVQFKGLCVTAPDRTVVDCLRTLRGRDALAIADDAWRRGLVSDETLLAVMERQRGWPGIVAARRILSRADPRRESPLESWSAWAFARFGVPTPHWQVDIREADRQLIGRVDCWWPGGVIGEADGRAKYAMAAAERGGGADAALAVLHSERDRERRLREVGAEIVRWGAADVLSDPKAEALARRIKGAIANAQARARFTGRAELAMLHSYSR
jgi:hypothetical protein